MARWTSTVHTKAMASKRNLVYACVCAYLGAISFGFMIGYTSPALPQMEGQVLDTEAASWFSSIATLGAILGCPLAGWMIEKYGRKGALLFTAIPFSVGWLLIVIGTIPGVLYIGRCLTGLASGMVTVVSPTYIAEIAPTHLRGMLGSGVQLGVTVGILLVYSTGMILSWRALAGYGLIIPLLAAFVTLRIPDTPRYYLVKNRKQDALWSLSWLRAPGTDVEDECRDIEESLDPEEKMSWRELLHPQLLQPLKVAVGLMVFQQLTGINVVMFYTVSIFRSAGLKESGEVASVMIGLVQVLGTVAACVLMDKAGRRQLLMMSGGVMAAATFTLGCYYYQMEEGSGMGWIALASLVIYIIAFSLGWGPIPMLMMSEIFPVRARGRASAITVFTNWSLAFIITKEFTFLQSTLGQHGTFWLYGACTATAVLFVYKLVPETKGKSLEDIELYFLGRAQMMARGVI